MSNCHAFWLSVFDFNAGFQVKKGAFALSNWLIGATYDIVTSSINDSFNSVQRMELSFVWLFGKKQASGSGAVRY